MRMVFAIQTLLSLRTTIHVQTCCIFQDSFHSENLLDPLVPHRRITIFSITTRAIRNVSMGPRRDKTRVRGVEFDVSNGPAAPCARGFEKARKILSPSLDPWNLSRTGAWFNFPRGRREVGTIVTMYVYSMCTRELCPREISSLLWAISENVNNIVIIVFF